MQVRTLGSNRRALAQLTAHRLQSSSRGEGWGVRWDWGWEGCYIYVPIRFLHHTCGHPDQVAYDEEHVDDYERPRIILPQGKLQREILDEAQVVLLPPERGHSCLIHRSPLEGCQGVEARVIEDI